MMEVLLLWVHFNKLVCVTKISKSPISKNVECMKLRRVNVKMEVQFSGLDESICIWKYGMQN